MRIIRLLALVLITAAPPAILLTYDRLGLFDGAGPHEPADRSASSEAAQEDAELEQAFEAFATTYHEELENYKQEIMAQWGEFKEAPASTWVSYDGTGEIRRTVDFESGRVQVEMIVSEGVGVNHVKGQLDRAVYRLMNTTEKQAYESDVVSNRVEQRLAGLGETLQKGQLGDDRLFSVDDLSSLKINFDGFYKVASNRGSVATTDIRAARKSNKYIVRVSFTVSHTIHERAVKYANAVAAAAEKERINDELIYAIIETESSFNPMAKSHIPAYGLMQIVPYTAGKDATKYLFGKAKVLSPSYLFDPNNNIAIGAAYLHVLHYKYMRKIRNRESRMYCAIAAYNTGASNVARAFIDQASFNKATPEINKLSPQEVYGKLRNYLPGKETRLYIEKVSRRMDKYL